MGQTAQTNNKFIEIVDGLIQAGLQGGADAMKAYLLTTPAAFLLGPVLSVFTNKVLAVLGDALYLNMHDVAAKIIINVQTEIETSAAKGALDGFKEALKTGDKEKISQAKSSFEKAIGSLIRSDGSRTR